MTFKELNFHQDIQEGLDAMYFEKPTPVQEIAIPVIMKGRDIIACAQTGTGKTAAFLLPILNELHKVKKKKIRAIIIAPTRELAQQIDQQFDGFSYFAQVSSQAVYGGGDGKSWTAQSEALKKGTEVIIATPGRLLSFLSIANIDLSGIEYLILDEADRMLDMGFNQDIMRIVDKLPLDRQTLLFSATMPPKIVNLAQNILRNPERVNVAISKPADTIRQEAYLTFDNQKPPLVAHILKSMDFESVIVFSSTKKNISVIQRELKKQGIDSKAMSSDLEQKEREQVMREFKGKKFKTLVATDIVSRGIDIKGISLVINYDIPSDAEDYIHRIGRTGRNESEGHAITLINDRDQILFYNIETLMDKVVDKIPMPDKIGVGPVYEPHRKRKNTNKNYGKKRFNSKFKGKPRFNKNSKPSKQSN
jgi:superfamily II DNA/RNA helicase